MVIKEGGKLTCSICGSHNISDFYKIKDYVYCRRCVLISNDRLANKNYVVSDNYQYNLNYKLTPKQKEASLFIVENIKKGKDVAINAVCGAGKTEIVYKVIKETLKTKKKIGITTPRKDVVIELYNRLKYVFKDNKITSIYGENNLVLEADIIIFTTHQAHRFKDYFDVLIIDEVDAFPYKDNDLLKQFVNNACKGNKIYLSATMPLYIEKDKNINKFYLNRRYHNFDLPVPKIIRSLFLIRSLSSFLDKHQNDLVLIFFPTISMLMNVSKKIKKEHLLLHSKAVNRAEITKKIKTMEKGVIFTTTVLERGVTLKNVHVLVYNADHKIFSKDTLIQISGRVGRNKNYPSGDIIFLARFTSNDMKEARRTIIKQNNG